MSFKKGVVYILVANILNLIISLFTGFALPKILSVDTYANIKLFQLYITYIGIFHLGFPDGVNIRIGGKRIENLDKKELASEFKTYKYFQIAVTVILILVSIILRNQMLLFCSLVILPINIGEYLRRTYQALGQFKKYSRFTNVNTFLIFFVNLFLLFIAKTDKSFVYIIAYVIAYIIYWIMIEVELKRAFGMSNAKANKEYLHRNINTGFFFMIGNFCNTIFTGIDRLFVQHLLGTVKFAFYSFAVSIETLMTVFITPISTVLYNYLCNNRKRDRVVQIKKLILLFAASIIAVIFPAKFIVQIWIQKYSESLNVLFVLFAAQCITIMVRCVHLNLYKAEKRQNRYFVIMMGIVVLSIVLNSIAYLIFKSMEAISVATLITSTIWFIIRRSRV